VADALTIESLASSLRYGGASLTNVPGLLRMVLQDDLWRDFTTSRGEHVTHETWESFVTTLPLKGLGSAVAIVDRIIGRDDPELLVQMRRAKRGGRGGRGKKTRVDSTRVSENGSRTDLAAERLQRDHPEVFERVKAGELSINAAAIAAGIRPHKVPIRLDDPASAAATIRKNMSPENLARLAELLTDTTGEAQP
jgi:hypothetical protein